jgi:septal ring factor EnvC (AmiA/AmiB activator)
MGNQNLDIKKSEDEIKNSSDEEIKKSEEEIKKSEEEIKKSNEIMKKDTRKQISKQNQLANYLKSPLIKLPKMLSPISSKKEKYLKYKRKYLRLKKLLDIN